MQRFIDPWFWLSMRPAPLSEQTTFALAVLTIVFLGAAVVHGVMMRQGRKTQEKPERTLHQKVQKILVFTTVFCVIWTFLGYEGVQLFSARIWMIGAVALVVYWAVDAWQYANGAMKTELTAITAQRGNKVYSASNKRA